MNEKVLVCACGNANLEIVVGVDNGRDEAGFCRRIGHVEIRCPMCQDRSSIMPGCGCIKIVDWHGSKSMTVKERDETR